MSVISAAVLSHSSSTGSVPLVGALRSGGRAFAQELSAAVPALRRRPAARPGDVSDDRVGVAEAFDRYVAGLDGPPGRGRLACRAGSR